MTDSQPRIALVTGAGRGLGKAMALKLAEGGFSVAVHYGRSSDEAEAVAGQIRADGGQAQTFAADLSVPANAGKLVEDVAAQLGGLHVLVNNAGITRDGLAIRMKDADWDAVMATNLSSAFAACRAAIKIMMRSRAGRIINISSVVGLMGNPGQANYVASKAGLIGLTKALAKEYGARNITVNAVAPGFIASDMTDALSDEQKAAYVAAIPLGRLGSADDVAALVAFLASDAAGYITGQIVGVDGGLYPH
ncbi:3-oxoacyl-[acyl-carrier-protein] reductase [Deinococcus sp.]|uniref:3-oxoacyl-[acyl-carrier-protein] reductase n=1 Tax=Deinococcus sp. TaxID=47478 RepID=UPI003B5B6679